jgi:hypothetical protein
MLLSVRHLCPQTTSPAVLLWRQAEHEAPENMHGVGEPGSEVILEADQSCI